MDSRASSHDPFRTGLFGVTVLSRIDGVRSPCTIC